MTDTDRLTLDEIVASNVRRYREAKGWTVAQVARQLDVGEHIVRDMERPRFGRPQREFSWNELAALCAVFDKQLWDLVLPEGDDIEVDTTVAYGERLSIDVSQEPSDDPDLSRIGATKATVWHAYPRRDDLAWRLFGLDAARLDSEKLREFTEGHKEQQKSEDVRALAEAMLPRVRRIRPDDTTKEE